MYPLPRSDREQAQQEIESEARHDGEYRGEHVESQNPQLTGRPHRKRTFVNLQSANFLPQRERANQRENRTERARIPPIS